MEQVTKYLNFDYMCKLASVATGVVLTQKVVGVKDGKSLKSQAKNIGTVVAGVCVGIFLHTGVVSYIHTHGHVVSSATKAGIVKAENTSSL